MTTPISRTGSLAARVDIRLRRIRSLKTNARNAKPRKAALEMAALEMAAAAEAAERTTDTANAATPPTEINAR